jgi:hypothetical protein
MVQTGLTLKAQFQTAIQDGVTQFQTALSLFREERVAKNDVRP